MLAWLRKMVLAQHNFRCSSWLVNGTAKATVCTCRKECNKYDLTDAQCLWLLAHHNDWSRWFAISSPPPICYPSFSFMGGTAKEVYN
jgi:hypothetical protein